MRTPTAPSLGVGRSEGSEVRSSSAEVSARQEPGRALFNTTQGVLYGDPDQEELKEVRKALAEAGIVHLFNPDEYRPWPTFYSREMVGVGLDEISWMIGKLSRSNGST